VEAGGGQLLDHHAAAGAGADHADVALVASRHVAAIPSPGRSAQRQRIVDNCRRKRALFIVDA